MSNMQVLQQSRLEGRERGRLIGEDAALMAEILSRHHRNSYLPRYWRRTIEDWDSYFPSYGLDKSGVDPFWARYARLMGVHDRV